ncbi:CD63 antigen [Dendrobates tinctorius]|uniref:CD63 antigen n=1 Tax=Dendrobates tinctorius TaxID=92724 RepID=UPI003CC9C7B2
MAVEGGMKCVKYLVFLFNLLFWICGCALIGLGIYVLVQMHNPQVFKSAAIFGPPIVIIAVGVVIFFISFFGCCGAVKENYCMVTTFAVLLGLIFLVEIAAAIAGYVYRNQLQSAFTDTITDGLQKYNKTTEAKKGIDDLQKGFKCCGANNFTDWKNYDPFKGTNDVPDTCCKEITPNCGRNLTNIYTAGCVPAIEALFKTNIGIIAGVALGIAFFEILGIVFACCLMKGIRSGYEVM